MWTELDALSHRLEHTFRRRELLEEAFRHSSYVNESGDPSLRDNERLEFLGDAVLDLSISHMLMDLFLDAPEGDLSKWRAMVVSERGLVRVAEMLGLGDCLRLGHGEELTQGRKKPSILANTLEALIGAIYLDAGFDRTDRLIRRLFAPLIQDMDMGTSGQDAKSLLQEYTQQRYRTRPEYVLLEESGPPHDRTFRIALLLHGRTVAESTGKSKKAAEQQVAREAYQCLVKDENDR